MDNKNTLFIQDWFKLSDQEIVATIRGIQEKKEKERLKAARADMLQAIKHYLLVLCKEAPDENSSFLNDLEDLLVELEKTTITAHNSKQEKEKNEAGRANKIETEIDNNFTEQLLGEMMREMGLE